jgi:hypothetical protein
MQKSDPTKTPMFLLAVGSAMVLGLCGGLIYYGTSQDEHTKIERSVQSQDDLDYVFQNVESLAQEWTKGLSEKGIEIRDGYEYNFVTKMMDPKYIRRPTGPAILINAPNTIGNVSVYICEKTGPDGYLFHTVDRTGEFHVGLQQASVPKYVEFCERGFASVNPE